MEFIQSEIYILVPCLYGLGMMLKKSTLIRDKYIPLLLLVISLILSCLYFLGKNGFSIDSFYTGLVQGILCVSASVFCNQIGKQWFKEE